MARKHARTPAPSQPLDRLETGVRDLRVEGQASARRLMVLGGVLVPMGLLVVLLLLSAPLWATASRRLADATLAEGASGCPDGLDAQQPPADRRRR